MQKMVALGLLLLLVGLVTGQHGTDQVYIAEFHLEHSGGTTGKILIKVDPQNAPIGAARFKQLVEKNFYKDACFFRVISGFMAQVGIPAIPHYMPEFKKHIRDEEKVVLSNTRGTVTFAMAGPNTRTTQIFFNFGDNSRLDRLNFPPFGEIISGIEELDRIKVTGEGAPNGPGPSQGLLVSKGNEYLLKNWPQVSCIRQTKIQGSPGGSNTIINAEKIATDTKKNPDVKMVAPAGLRDPVDPKASLYIHNTDSNNFMLVLGVVVVFGVVFFFFRSNKKATQTRDLDA